MCQLHPFHGDGLIHLPGHTLSQDLGTGEAGEDTSLSPIHFFSVLHILCFFFGNLANVFFMALRITCTVLSRSQRKLASISAVTLLAPFFTTESTNSALGGFGEAQNGWNVQLKTFHRMVSQNQIKNYPTLYSTKFYFQLTWTDEDSTVTALNNWNLRRTTISSLRSTWESVEFIVRYIYTNRQENILVPALQWLS